MSFDLRSDKKFKIQREVTKKEISLKDLNILELIQFSERNPWKIAHPKPLMEKFLTEFISNKNLVFDVHDEKGRAALAVLMDKVNNPANDTCLEILGIRPDVNQSEMVSKLISLALSQVPKNKNGFQLALPERFPFEKLSNQSLLNHYYDIYNMQMLGLIRSTKDSFPQISIAEKPDAQIIYRILCRSFEKNPETSIPDFTSWSIGFLSSSRSHFFVWREGSEIIGFANLIQEENADGVEIRTVGVLPEFRGQGIGRDLLRYSLARAYELGCTSCHLSVAVSNQKALKLYQSLGFKVVEKSSCYRVEIRK